MAEDLGVLSFVSWVRQGLAAGIPRVDGDPTAPRRAQTIVPIDVNFDNGLTGHSDLALVGPGDIVGLDGRVAVRFWPRADDNDAEHENLALIEFDQADLPWRYSPASANSSSQLKPWINLVVVKDGDEGSLVAPTAAVKQTLLSTDVSHLPDLTQSWAWAHTQCEGDNLTASQVGDRISGQPGLFAARLMCPRVLEPSTRYIACVVPTFKRGQLVGSGGTLDDNVDALDLAWQAGTAGAILLPAYFYWRFQTGTAGSFEQLARLIVPKPVPAQVGRRALDVQNPGLALPRPASTTLDSEGALQSVEAFQAGPSPWLAEDRAQWVSKLKLFLNQPDVTLPDGRTVKVVAPPLYARWYATQDTLSDPSASGTNPPWFFELNSDPRERVGAGLGTVVIQNEQQALLSSAWKQVGELNAVNAQLKVAQLGREVWGSVYVRHLVTGTDDTFWNITARLHAYAQCGGKSVCEQFETSAVGGWLFDPIWLRLSRPLGRLGRFQGWPLLPPGSTSTLVDRLNRGQRPAPEPPTPRGLFTPDLVSQQICFDGLTVDDLGQLRGLGPELLLFWGLAIVYTARKLIVTQGGVCFWHALRMLRFGIWLIRLANDGPDGVRRLHWCASALTCDDVLAAAPAPNFAPILNLPSSVPLPPLLGGASAHDTADATAFRNALCAVINQLQPPPPLTPPPSIPSLPECRDQLRLSLDPQLTVVRRFQTFYALDATLSLNWKPLDPLEPIFAPPEYEQPMYAPLADVSQDWVVPNINQVTPNTAGIALTNQRFVEAYMAGLNQEMTRELLWNEFPTDQRGTYFRQFWDIAGIVPPQGSTINPETLRDILPLASWSKTGLLGSNSPRPPAPGGGERLVLLLRAQLIQKYPNVIVYAVRATQTSAGRRLSTNPSDEMHPVFYALLKPDVGFYGFDLTLADIRGNPGWFFVLQEQPGEPKFEGLTTPGQVMTPPNGTSGEVAQNIFRDPFRIAIHGSLLVPPAN